MWKNQPRLSQGSNPLIFQAHGHMRAGDFEAAAALFEKLAGEDSERAPGLYLQAGKARLLSGQQQTGLDLLKRGLSLLESESRWHELEWLGQRSVADLNEEGLEEAAGQLSSWLEVKLRQGDEDA